MIFCGSFTDFHSLFFFISDYYLIIDICDNHPLGLRRKGDVTDQLKEDEGEDAGEEAHDGNPHDYFEDVTFVVDLIFRDLDLFV